MGSISNIKIMKIIENKIITSNTDVTNRKNPNLIDCQVIIAKNLINVLLMNKKNYLKNNKYNN